MSRWRSCDKRLILSRTSQKGSRWKRSGCGFQGDSKVDRLRGLNRKLIQCDPFRFFSNQPWRLSLERVTVAELTKLAELTLWFKVDITVIISFVSSDSENGYNFPNNSPISFQSTSNSALNISSLPVKILWAASNLARESDKVGMKGLSCRWQRLKNLRMWPK